MRDVADARDRELAEVRRQLAERDTLIEQLRAEIAKLKEKVRKSSLNSSKPPSSDGPWVRNKKRKRRKPSTKKRGGQPGHPKHERPVVPEEELDAIHEVKPSETSWRVAGKRAWLWVVVTPIVTFFAIHSNRSAQAARATLGDSIGVLISDRFSSYSWWPLKHRQVCWSKMGR